MAEYLTTNTDLTVVADAIRSKTGKTDKLVYPSGFASEIEKLSDTSDATATSDDIASGKTAYVKGQKVAGAVTEVTRTGSDDATTFNAIDGDSRNVEIAANYTANRLMRAGSTVIVHTSPKVLGSATASDVVAGKTFSGAAGVKVKGTASEVEPGFEVSILLDSADVVDAEGNLKVKSKVSNDTMVRPGGLLITPLPVATLGNATASDVVAGKTFSGAGGFKVVGTYTPLDTSDATAAASDIVKDKTAYVNGSKVTGTMADLTSAGATYSSGAVAQGVFRAYGKSNSTGKITRTSTAVTMNIPSNNLGNAAAQHVKEGVTFTSEAGLKLTGTAATVNTGSPSFIDNHWTDDTSYRVLANPKTNGFCMYDTPIETPVSKSQFGDATASDVAKGKTFTSQNGLKITGTKEEVAVPETWVWNETIANPGKTIALTIPFTTYTSQAAGGSWYKIIVSSGGISYYMTKPATMTTDVYGTGSYKWTYYPMDRKITFLQPPTGNLLTFLQANAVKQDSNTAVQPSKSVTITENGTTTVTPDAPFDAVESVSVTVNVPTSAGYTVTFPGTATNWGQGSDNCHLILADGSQVDMSTYDTVAGKTIQNVVALSFYSTQSWMSLAGKVSVGSLIMLCQNGPYTVGSTVCTDGMRIPSVFQNTPQLTWVFTSNTTLDQVTMVNTD